MPDLPFAPGVAAPDVYIAALGRSGSTMIANWLARPPHEVVLVEPFLFAACNPDIARIQVAALGGEADPALWELADADWQARFRRLFAPVLAGKRWAVKEVLAREHALAIARLVPSRVVVTVRDIGEIAASFLEKHRRQGNRHRFGPDWVEDYCLRESAAIVGLCDAMTARDYPHLVVRYEDFVADAAARASLADFTGWEGGGDPSRHLDAFGRAWEAERHGGRIGPAPADRGLAAEEQALVDRIVLACAAYQHRFGYGPAGELTGQMAQTTRPADAAGCAA